MTKKVKERAGFHYLLTVYFDFFGIEHIPQEVLNKIIKKKLLTIFKIQGHDSIMGRFYCIAFIEYMLPKNLC